MSALQFFWWFGGTIIGYAILSRGLFLATDAARQSMIEHAAVLIESNAVSPEEKKRVRASLNDAYSWPMAWCVAATSAWLLILQLARRGQLAVESPVPPMLRANHDAFLARWLVATLGNSLAATIFFAIFALLNAALMVSFNTLSRSVAASAHHDAHGHQAA